LSLLELTATLGIKVVYERAHWELVNEVKAIRKKKKVSESYPEEDKTIGCRSG